MLPADAAATRSTWSVDDNTLLTDNKVSNPNVALAAFVSVIDFDKDIEELPLKSFGLLVKILKKSKPLIIDKKGE